MTTPRIEDLMMVNGEMLRQMALVLAPEEFERTLGLVSQAIKAGQSVVGLWAASRSACVTVFVFEHRVVMWSLTSAPDADAAQRAASECRRAYAQLIGQGLAPTVAEASAWQVRH